MEVFVRTLVKSIFMIATTLILSSSLAGASTLKEALFEGQFNGMLRFMYEGGDNNTDSTAPGPLVVDIPTGKGKWAAASVVHLDYASSDFYGFKLGLSFQASHDFTNTKYPTPRLGFSQTRVNQAYLQYDLGFETNVKVGAKTSRPL